MAGPATSELLTLRHTIKSASNLRIPTRRVPQSATSRLFSITTPQLQKDIGPNKEHAVDKAANGDPNIQSQAARQGIENRKSGTGGHATEGRDARRTVENAKKSFPNAPDPVIGMQDERGGKGH